MLKEINRDCKRKEIMEKELVPYQPSLDLKELGFDEPCLNLYHKDTRQIMYNPIDNVVMIKIDNHNKTNHCSAPLYQQAFRWFREKYGLHTWITSKTNDKGETVYIPHGRTLPDTTKNSLIVDIIPYYTGKSSEEAELECLKKLIEIVKEK